MGHILTCTWAPTALAEGLGIDYLLVAQRWWGSGQEIEGSSYDGCGSRSESIFRQRAQPSCAGGVTSVAWRRPSDR
jgi:hypothetical protein